MSLVSWNAIAAVRNGVTFDGDYQRARHLCWYLEEIASGEEIKKAVAGAAHLVASRINAFDVKLIDARRAMCVGFLMRSFFAFYFELLQFIAPNNDQMSTQAMGHIMDQQGEESDSLHRQLRRAERQIDKIS